MSLEKIATAKIRNVIPFRIIPISLSLLNGSLFVKLMNVDIKPNKQKSCATFSNICKWDASFIVSACELRTKLKIKISVASKPNTKDKIENVFRIFGFNISSNISFIFFQYVCLQLTSGSFEEQRTYYKYKKKELNLLLRKPIFQTNRLVEDDLIFSRIFI